MQYTLLQLVQSILSSIDGDEINSITDSVEAGQVVTIIKTVYDDISSRGELPVQKTLFNLDASGDSSKPVLMTKPTNVQSVEWLKYDRQTSSSLDPEWADITYICVDDFLRRVYTLNPSESTTDSFSTSIGGSTVNFFYKNNQGPNFYTTFDDQTVVFDAYDSAVDTTLQSAKTLGYGLVAVTFTESDSWVPSLHPHQFAWLLNEAKSLAWAELRQAAHVKAEMTARKHEIINQKTRHAFNYGKYDKGPNYGRL
jgi:hypothetical protein